MPKASLWHTKKQPVKHDGKKSGTASNTQKEGVKKGPVKPL